MPSAPHAALDPRQIAHAVAQIRELATDMADFARHHAKSHGHLCAVIKRRVAALCARTDPGILAAAMGECLADMSTDPVLAAFLGGQVLTASASWSVTTSTSPTAHAVAGDVATLSTCASAVASNFDAAQEP